MKHLIKHGIISLLISISSCNSSDDFSSFISEDASKYNYQISSAVQRNEVWTKTPYLIVGRLFGPEFLTEGKQKFAIEQSEVTNEHVRIIVTQEGLADDSVYGEKRIIEFKYKANRWIIVNIKLGFLCQLERGQQHYSGKLCD